MSVSNYQILQRNEQGFAIAYMEGKLPKGMKEGDKIFVCAYREESNFLICPWEEATVEQDTWKGQMQLPEGGLYRLEACWQVDGMRCDWADRISCVRHVGVGDLYMITGQSNMAGYGRDTAYDPPCLGVHLYGNNGKWDIAAHPLNDSVDTIYPENEETMTGTSPVLSFARCLKQELGIPIGLVQASMGSSPLSMWHPEEDGRLYRGMLRRLDVVGRVKGILWYQGCAESMDEKAFTYLERFSRMVELWREQLGDVPFLTVQLNRRAVNVEGSGARAWGILKEAQRQAARVLPRVYVVPSHDVPQSDGCHNSSTGNVIIGERLARTALTAIYGRAGQLAPDVDRVEYVDATHVKVIFNHSFEMSCTESCGDGKVEDFEVEDAGGMAGVRFAQGSPGQFLLTLDREITLPAKFHALWRRKLSSRIPHDVFGMPMLGCYGVEIESQKGDLL